MHGKAGADVNPPSANAPGQAFLEKRALSTSPDGDALDIVCRPSIGGSSGYAHDIIMRNTYTYCWIIIVRLPPLTGVGG